MPEISVIMTVFNAESYLKESIDSILNQTYRDFELIIVDDGSTDKSYEILKSYNDSRINLYRLIENKGVGFANNIALSKADGKYIAKADADDIYDCRRLKIQKDYLDKNKDVDIVGTLINYFPDNEKVANTERYNNLKFNYENQLNEVITYDQIKHKIYEFCVMVHTTYMGRADVIRKVGYDKSLKVGEDYKLFYNLNELGYKMVKIPEKLVECRISMNSTTVYQVLDIYKVIYDIKKEKIENMCNDADEVFIWGAGNFGVNIKEIALANNVDLTGFIDSKESLWNNYVSNLKVFSPDILNNKLKNKKVLVASEPGRKNIIDQLIKLNYKHLIDFIVF